MRDDFDSVVANRFKVLDHVPVPDTWSRVQRSGQARRSPRTNQEVLAMIDLETPVPNKTRQKGPMRVVVAGLLAAAAVVAIALVVTRDRNDTAPVDQPSPAVTVTPTTSALPSLESGPGAWPTYASTRYDFTVGHPPDWTEVPSSRGWSWETDSRDWLSPAHEAFISPDNAVRVSAWNAPFDSSAPEESIDDLVAWVEDYCERSANGPCTGIADRAVELCLEARDCHPGLLVPFRDDVQAFFSGGIYDSEAMTIVAVWRSESHPSVAPYGGAQQLLESFLSTMEVWPATTPFAERD